MPKTDTPLKWVHFSTANHPDTWDTQEQGVIQFSTSFEAKKAEALFSRLERERGELIDLINDIHETAQLTKHGTIYATRSHLEIIENKAARLLAKLKETP